MSRKRRSAVPGADFARLVLRLSVGSTMVAHGVKHARSLEGTGRWFASIGFREPELQAKTSAVVEVGAGAAVAAGLLTPFSASAVIGTMTVAARTVHIPNGFFITSEGYEYVAAITAASTALSALGPGRYSLDRVLGIDERLGGVRAGLLALGLGVAGAFAQLAVFWRRPAAS